MAAYSVGIVGGTGWLGRSIGRHALQAGFIPPGSLIVSSRSPPAGAYGEWPDVRWTADNGELARLSDAVILSVRPQQFGAVEIDAGGRLVISVMAGVSVETLKRRTKSDRVVRSMPNAAAEIGRSYTPWFAAGAVSETDRLFVQALFGCCGTADEVPLEAHLDYLTGLSGSGPAFPALLADAMLSHALSRGLPPDVARRAVENVVCDASQLLRAPGQTPEAAVKTFLDYRGTTAAGLQAMVDGGFEAAVHAGLAAAAEAAERMASESNAR